jgi:hypothetical protein
MTLRFLLTSLIVVAFLSPWSRHDASTRDPSTIQQRDTTSWAKQFDTAATRLKGLEYCILLDMPFGLRENDHWVVPNPPDYDIVVVDYKKDSLHALIVTKLVFLDTVKTSDKPPRSRIYDALAISFEQEHMLLVGQYCQCNGQNDDAIIALVRQDDSEYFEDIVRAWRVNKELMILEEIPTQGIRCENMGYGD